jgi:hypothetical protein
MNPRWLLLTHQIPSEPSNARVKVWRRLQTLGAAPIKNSIYVLPNRPDTREDFEWLRKEIVQLKGEAALFVGNSISEVSDKEIIKTFQDLRSKDFSDWIEQATILKESIQLAI